MQLSATTAKYALVLMSIGGATAGLNLGVMELTDPPSTKAAEEVLLSAGSEPVAQDPLQVVVDVPVVVPDSVVSPTLPEAAPSPVVEPEPAKASFSASTPAAPAPAQSTVQAAATTTSSDMPRPKTAPPATATTKTTEPRAQAAAPSSTRAPTTVAATQYKYYDFSGVASQIIVARHGDGSLEFWAVTTETGWNYRVEQDTSRLVELKFSQEPNGEGEATWLVQYKDGNLEVKKEMSLGDDENEYEDEHEEEDD